jgi:hypothetical protein
MASGKSSYLSKKLLDDVLGATAYTGPATVYVALWTSALDGTSTGATAGETAYTGYARVAITNNTTNFPAATGSSNGSKNNANAITFAANGGAASTITYVCLVDSASGAGNILWWGSITSTTINSGDTPQINANGLTVTEA